MLSIDKHCEMLSNTIRDKSAAMYDGFRLFIQMFSGVVGGSVVLRLQYSGKIPPLFVFLANALATLVVITAAIIIMDHYRSWYGYRKELSKVAGQNLAGEPQIPPANLCWSAGMLAVMLIVMAVALIGFFKFNPFQISN